LHSIAESLEKIRQLVERWSQGRGGTLSVWTRDADRADDDEQWQYAVTGHGRSLAYPGLKPVTEWVGRFSLLRAVVRSWRYKRDERRRVRGRTHGR
jgi:hypothetical protein